MKKQTLVDSWQFEDLTSMSAGLRELEETARRDNGTRTAPVIYVQNANGHAFSSMTLEVKRLTDGSPAFYITLEGE